MEKSKNVTTILFVEESSFVDLNNETHTYDKLFIKGVIENEEVQIVLRCVNPADKRDLKRIINHLREVN